MGCKGTKNRKKLFMKRVELIQFNSELLKRLQKAGVKIDDWQYASIVDDYHKMLKDGHKRTYAIIKLAEKYKISERCVYDLLRRLCEDCKVVADG
jgi:hypothetical protein